MSAPAVDASAPVRWSEELGALVVTGYDEASALLRAPDRWSSDPRRAASGSELLGGLPPAVLLFMDPPDHTRMRRLLGPLFTPRALEPLRPRITVVVDAALDALASTADVVSELGYLVPLAVIAELLDVGTEGAEVMREHTPALVRMLEADATGDDLAASAAAALELSMFLVPLLAERREHPGEDFISALLQAEGIELDEVAATVLLLLAAGHETTANLIASGTSLLLQHRDQLPYLLADSDRAVEEMLRYETPVQLVGRVSATEQMLAGYEVAAGDLVVVHIGAANRDPARFVDGDRLDLSRAGPPHLGFGAGPHFCLGAGMARMEAAETLTRLFARFPGLALEPGPVRWRASRTFRALESLPVRTA